MNNLRKYISECVHSELARREVRNVVSEEVYRMLAENGRGGRRMLREWMLEAEKDVDGDDGEKEKNVSRKNNMGGIENRKRQVLALLRQDRFDLAAIARKVWADMDDDSLRSKISKIVRGELEMDDADVPEFYAILRASHD